MLRPDPFTCVDELVTQCRMGRTSIVEPRCVERGHDIMMLLPRLSAGRSSRPCQLSFQLPPYKHDPSVAPQLVSDHCRGEERGSGIKNAACSLKARPEARLELLRGQG